MREREALVRLDGLSVVVEKYTPVGSIGFSEDAVREARERQALGGKVIVVVGAGYSGIGGATAREAAIQGATVVTVSRQKDDNSLEKQLVEELRVLGSQGSLWIPADITNRGDRERVISQVVQEFGRIDGLVIATAVLDDGFFVKMTEEQYRGDFETNYFGPLFLLQSAINQMSRGQNPRGGKIVIVSSLSAVEAPFQAEYGPAKAALDNMIASLPGERLYRGVSFNGVAPGLVETPMISGLSSEQRQVILERTRADRPLLSQEVAELITYLLSSVTDTNGGVFSIVGRGDTPPIDNRMVIPR